MIVRNLSLSKLRKLLSSSSLSSYTYRTPAPVSNSTPSTVLSDSSHFPSSQNPSKTLPLFFFTKYFSTQQIKNQPSPNLTLSRDGNYDEAASDTLPSCPGCGIQMQESDPKQPGYFIEPSPKSHREKKIGKKGSIVDESDIPDILKRGLLNEIVEIEQSENPDIPDKGLDGNLKNVKNLGGLDEKVSERPIVCARCHSLRHYGRVKHPGAESLLPDFDFDHTVGRRLISTTGARSVVLMVVDAVDFDGSFPKKVAELVSRTIDDNSRAWKEGKSGNVPRVVLVVTKIDLLPSSISPTRLEHWVRARAREGGAGKLTSVHMVSAVKEWGVKNLVDDVAGLVGQRGQVWAIGAQNAGKSTLINAIGNCVGRKLTHLTEAPVPGTTLGIVRMEGVFPGSAKLFDTPGLLHPHQITTRLTWEEQKLVHVGKELTPRTYRIKAGHSVHIGGLMRLDIEESSVDSIYVTIWASPLLPLHMGKTENASKMLEEHFGRRLQPPMGEGRVAELGKWVKKEVSVSGSWWDSSCVDIAAAGLGWFAIGLKGEAQLGVWTYDGVEIAVRNALLPQRSHKFEVAGFTVSEIVSKADRARNKQRKDEKKKRSTKSGPVSSTSSSASTVDEEMKMEVNVDVGLNSTKTIEPSELINGERIEDQQEQSG